MLTETLGILIGYVTIILMFSLMITSLVQAVQHLSGIRWKFLRRNIAWLLNELNTRKIVSAPIPDVGETAAQLVGRGVTWLERDELLKDLAQKGIVIPPDQLASFDTQFAVMSRYASKEFEGRAKTIALVFSLVLAFGFQLSTFDLLQRLSTEPQLRANLEAEGEAIVRGSPPADLTTQADAFAEVASKAIEQLSARHPELKATFEELSGAGTDRAAIVAELRITLAAHQVAHADDLAAEYEQLVDEAHTEAGAAHLAEVRRRIDRLALYDIVVWPHGWGFYSSPSRCIGVLVSCILLSLGAPFWFNTLKNLMNLRDTLKPRDAVAKS